MRRTVLTLTLLTAPIAAQQPKPPVTSATPASPPAGWTIRLDAKDSSKSASDTRFVTMGSGYHVTSGPAALYYNPQDVATGSYTVRATFGQRKAPAMGHPEAYGVFIGGAELVDNGKQQYMYLVVRGDGMFYVAHRGGVEVHPIVPWQAHDVVKKQNEAGAAANEVAIQVTADSVHMLVNGQRVKSFDKKDMHGFNTDGQYGLRVNHGLDVHVGNFGVQK